MYFNTHIFTYLSFWGHLFCFAFCKKGLLLFPGGPTTQDVYQAVIGLAPVVPLPPKGRDFRHELPCQGSIWIVKCLREKEMDAAEFCLVVTVTQWRRRSCWPSRSRIKVSQVPPAPLSGLYSGARLSCLPLGFVWSFFVPVSLNRDFADSWFLSFPWLWWSWRSGSLQQANWAWPCSLAPHRQNDSVPVSLPGS